MEVITKQQYQETHTKMDHKKLIHMVFTKFTDKYAAPGTQVAWMMIRAWYQKHPELFAMTEPHNDHISVTMKGVCAGDWEQTIHVNLKPDTMRVMSITMLHYGHQVFLFKYQDLSVQGPPLLPPKPKVKQFRAWGSQFDALGMTETPPPTPPPEEPEPETVTMPEPVPVAKPEPVPVAKPEPPLAWPAKPSGKLTPDEVRLIRSLKGKRTLTAISQVTGRSMNSVVRVLNGTIYSDVV